MLSRPEPACLLIADISGYTELYRREREAAATMRDFIGPLVELGQSNLHDLLVEEMARRSALAAEAPPEPAAPESLERELREPIRL